MKLTPAKGKWFKYPGDEEVEICIKRVPVDAFKGDLDFFDKAVTDWRGINDADNNPVPCTRETKLYVLFETEEGGELSFWIMRKAISWNEFVDLDELKKKLEPTLNGGSTTQKQTEQTV